MISSTQLRPLLIGLAALVLGLTSASRAQAEAKLLIDAATGKVLHAENATHPWYPASVTKLMTAYTTLQAIKEGRLGFNTLLTVSRNAVAQQPTKMGFLFTLNRETGEPVFPIIEKPVPQDAVPGEHPSPTQPFPTAPPSLVRQGPVSPNDSAKTQQ